MNKPKLENKSVFKKKIIKIFIHGFLHLIGHDHKTDNDYKKMQKEENKIYNLIENKFTKLY